MSTRSQIVSLAIHVLFVALLLLLTVRRGVVIPEAPLRVDHLFAPVRLHAPAGGGGMREPEPVRKGVLPPSARRIFTPPMIQRNPQPKLTMAMAIEAPPVMPVAGVVGDPNGIGALSGGMGSLGGLGVGRGHSIGRGVGDLVGTGDGTSVTFGATRPVPIRIIEPEYSEEARHARVGGTVLVYAEIGPDGKPRNLKVTRGLGLGLDEKALDAAAQWLFKPGMKNGRPVTVRATFEVNFRLL